MLNFGRVSSFAVVYFSSFPTSSRLFSFSMSRWFNGKRGGHPTDTTINCITVGRRDSVVFVVYFWWSYLWGRLFYWHIGVGQSYIYIHPPKWTCHLKIWTISKGPWSYFQLPTNIFQRIQYSVGFAGEVVVFECGFSQLHDFLNAKIFPRPRF